MTAPEPTAKATPDLAALRALLADATPGPWEQGQAQDGEVLADGTGYAGDYESTADVFVMDDDGYCRTEFNAGRRQDAALIVAAVNVLPALLAEVEAAGRLRAGVEALADALTARADHLVRQEALEASEHVRRCSDDLRALLAALRHLTQARDALAAFDVRTIADPPAEVMSDRAADAIAGLVEVDRALRGDDL